ncbi:MAG: hypothetical protein RIR70_1822 [Pseudomonadota bacterium]|jgi:hypothetical protein
MGILRALLVCGLIISNVEASCRVTDPELASHYEGGCQNGLAEGVGFARGSAQYSGDFQAGMKHGKGVKTWPNGDRYEGQFEADQKHGEGTYTWGERSLSPNTRYTGHFAHDEREGPGAYTTASGAKLETEWLKGVPVAPLPPQWQAYASSILANEALAAPGGQVCKSVILGHGTQDWLTATVIASDGLRATLRIDHAGAHPHAYEGEPIAEGHALVMPLAGWKSCVHGGAKQRPHSRP